ncbi:uncharacterized protein LY89DRAFT_328300 [Mollisia scopiformis]|uniref:Tat pathway signal sequence n=1 Tax=Mollisia scopiformis TaxID=149040 RepID=A0A132B8Z7_MOLSC|nr:uncharacterized protein LY89DRAFT_328300 [Mollisia scopiformis]KUJ08878.1 hypothetical protein LY89DRAFT_328300 [Mollisia scopiformis]
MAFIFTMRSTGSSMHRRDPASGSSLPAISEDSASFLEPRSVPAIPDRAITRPSTRIWALGSPPVHTFEEPPPYNQFDGEGVLGPRGEKLSNVRRGVKENKWIAKRGGWKRLALIALIVIACIVGLAVGLAVGLKHHSSSKDTNSGNSSSPSGGASGTVGGPGNPASNTTFPAGSYRFDTFLDTVSTDCTNNSATWLCYPYSTYAQNAGASAATFEWIIYPDNNSPNYTISSTDNYFSIVFSNLTLSLMNSGASDEHYFFQTMMSKPTKPAVQLGSQNVASTCYFNQTTFQAYLYTKMPKSYPPSTTNTTDPSGAFIEWPYAVKVEQVAGAGPNVPTCVGPSGQVLGDFSVADETQLCDCLYLNTGT